jgi:hypothetical protein
MPWSLGELVCYERVEKRIESGSLIGATIPAQSGNGTPKIQMPFLKTEKAFVFDIIKKKISRL